MTNGSELPPHTSLTSVRKGPPPPVMVGPLLKSVGIIPVRDQKFSGNPAYWAEAGKRHRSMQLSMSFKEHFVFSAEGYAAQGHLEVFELTRSGQGIANEVEDYLRSRADLRIETAPCDLALLLAEQFEFEGRPALPRDNIGAVFFQRSLKTKELLEVSVRFPSWEEGRVEISVNPLFLRAGVLSRPSRINSNHIEGRRFIVRAAI